GQHVKQRAAPAVAGLVSDRGRWQLEADEPAVQLLDETGRVDCRQAGCGPADEWGAQLDDPVVVSVKERRRVLRRQVLDAERAERPKTTRATPSRGACATR